MMLSMRTTLTLDDDLARRLKELARQQDRSFKDVVNGAIRRGLSAGEPRADSPPRFRVEPKECGFRPGLDPLKLNQIYDDLEVREVAERPDTPDPTS
jgi:hypothetical protein